MNCTFSLVTPTPQLWAEIETFADSACFTTRKWADYLVRMKRPPLLISVASGGDIKGYFIGHRRRFPLRIVAAPPSGTGTYAQGLCMREATDGAKRVEIYRQLAAWLIATHKADYIKVCDWQLRTDSDDWIDGWAEPLLDAAGIRYSPRYTYHVDTSLPEDELWRRLSQKSARYSIGKARKSGLEVRTVERAEDIPDFVRRHHAHIEDVCRRHRNKGIPCQREKNMLALCQSLFPDQVLMLEVVGPDGDETVSMASGIFVVHAHTGTYFTGGSFEKYMHLCPNELLVWEAMRRLNGRGAADLIFGGMAHYKRKFGPRFAAVPVMVFSRYKLLLGLRQRFKQTYFRLCQMAYRLLHPSR